MVVLKRLCIYCGSKTGWGAGYTALARGLGAQCAARNVGIVFGGGHIGMMGELAAAALDAGGEVTGIIPKHLYRPEVAYEEISELVVVDSMHERKRLMAERSDAFCVLPGGLGTLDETVEILTWKQLGLHDKPIVLLDHEGFWQPFLTLMEHQEHHGFVNAAHRSLFEVAGDIDAVFTAVANNPAPRWPAVGNRL